MSYQQYGISPDLVERVKFKLKNPATKEQVKMILHGVTKYDLQDRWKVKRLIGQMSKVLNERLSDQMEENIVQFVIAVKIDPNNTFHLIKLWNMFR